MADIEFKALPPDEAVDYFRKKGYKTTFSWKDMWEDEHAYSFTVAKAMRRDILQDIRAAMDKAIADGTTLRDFKKQLVPTLQAKGWWGKKAMTDPLTGEEKTIQLGSARRLQTIFDTNMRSAYAAGKWEQVERTKKSRPYLRYLAIMDGRTRPQHRDWNDTVLPADDPFWDSHYPPNGWNCRCTVQQLGTRELERFGVSVNEKAPPSRTVSFRDKRNGRVVSVPKGIDPGFGYNVGKARMRALTAPPIDRPLEVPFNGNPADVPMPEQRRVDKSVILPDGLPPEHYVESFLEEFGAAPGKPVVFTDPSGERIVISDDLFKTASGKLKVMKDLRYRYLPLLAKTIQDPDEIWIVWEEYPAGRWTLMRKYIARYDVEGQGEMAFTLFDTSSDGWRGVTTFRPKKSDYIERQRAGSLVYRRKK